MKEGIRTGKTSRPQKYATGPRPVTALKFGTFAIQSFFRVSLRYCHRPPFTISPTMTQDQIKDLKGRAEALRRYL